MADCARMDSYAQFVAGFRRLVEEGGKLPFGGFSPLSPPDVDRDAPKGVLFSPHPDDECLTGGLALRLLRQSGMRVLNVPVTFGSRPERRLARREELKGACGHLGFELVEISGRDGDGFASVEALAGILRKERPTVLFFPHDNDFNSSHLRTHRRVVAALERSGDFSCWTVETEFWHPMEGPNLLVELADRDLADLLGALSFHEGELRRNPYHLAAPGWFIDTVRRGSEIVGGQGGAAAGFLFGTLYRLRRWEKHRFVEPAPAPRLLSASRDPGALFQEGLD